MYSALSQSVCCLPQHSVQCLAYMCVICCIRAQVEQSNCCPFRLNPFDPGKESWWDVRGDEQSRDRWKRTEGGARENELLCQSKLVGAKLNLCVLLNDPVSQFRGRACEPHLAFVWLHESETTNVSRRWRGNVCPRVSLSGACVPWSRSEKRDGNNEERTLGRKRVFASDNHAPFSDKTQWQHLQSSFKITWLLAMLQHLHKIRSLSS